MNGLWSLHGLVVRCDDVTLDARPAAPGAEPDVHLAVASPGPVTQYGEPVGGRVLAALDSGPDAPSLTVVEAEPATPGLRAAVTLHFHGRAVATIDPTRHRVELRLAPGVDPDLASVLLGGTVVSALLALRGHPVLHASAVVPATDPTRAVAFVGSSGMGKSTTATLACRDGASLLADDVLRTDVVDGTVVAHAGATALRLRPAAHGLGAETTTDLRTTGDQRLAVTPATAPATPLPLGALVVPRPDRTSTELRVEALTGVDAVLTLASHPRILGWRDPRTLAEAHEHWGLLARHVPLFLAHVPWGPPFAAGLGSALVSRVLDLT